MLQVVANYVNLLRDVIDTGSALVYVINCICKVSLNVCRLRLTLNQQTR